jgi:cytidine deaminase
MTLKEIAGKKREPLLSEANLAKMTSYAWKSQTAVGCAILTDTGRIVTGANIEGLWMTSIHAEVSAITKMDLNRERIQAIAIVADCERFTPCGACLDWLMQFSQENCAIYIRCKDGRIWESKVFNLYPNYPKK